MIGYIGKRHRQMLIKRGTRLAVIVKPARRTCRGCRASPPCFLLYLSGLSAVLVAVATPPCCTCRTCRDSRTCTCGTCRACRRHSRLSALREEPFFRRFGVSAFWHSGVPMFWCSDALICRRSDVPTFWYAAVLAFCRSGVLTGFDTWLCAAVPGYRPESCRALPESV